jgi:glycogen(starch) synthase
MTCALDTNLSTIVGGIYTVLRTKAPVTVQEFGERYTMIGPLNMRTAPVEVEELEPTNPLIRESLEEMRQAGVHYLYGRWLIEGAPKVLLFDIGSVSHRLNEWKTDLWNMAGVPSPPDDRETNDAVLFGFLVCWFLDVVSDVAWNHGQTW